VVEGVGAVIVVRDGERPSHIAPGVYGAGAAKDCKDWRGT
jgi:hypothetical protein